MAMTHIEDLDANRDFYSISIAHLIKQAGFITENEQDMWRWLRDTPGGEYSLGGRTIYFYEEKDASMFALRWS
jgi:hypothetical protein